MAGQRTLNPRIVVRIHVPEPTEATRSSRPHLLLLCAIAAGGCSDDDGAGGQGGGSTASSSAASTSAPSSASGGGGSPCASNATIELVSAPTHAIAGSLYSDELYVQDGPTAATWQPTKVRARVLVDGDPLPACRVHFAPEEGAGWFFADDDATDAGGEVAGWWVAGNGPSSTLRISIEREAQPDAEVELIGSVSIPHTNLAPAPYLSFPSPQMSRYAIDATPVTAPNFTYYQVIGWEGSYAGLQRTDDGGGHLVIWSLWDVGGVSAQIVSAPPSSSCDPFGGAEGTGIQCLFPYPWTAGDTYRFEAKALRSASEILPARGAIPA